MRLSKASLSEQTIINPNTKTRKKRAAESILRVVKTMKFLPNRYPATLHFWFIEFIIRELPLLRVPDYLCYTE